MAPPRRTRLTVRWESALPVKQASLRRGLGDAAALADVLQFLKQDEPFYRVAVVGIPGELTEAVASLGELRDATTLRARGRTALVPVDVRLMYEDGLLGIEFHFLRTEPIALDDGEVEFITKLGRVQVRRTFKLAEMMFESYRERRRPNLLNQATSACS